MQEWLEAYLVEKEANAAEAKTKNEQVNALQRAHSARNTLEVFEGAAQRLDDYQESDFMASVGQSIARSESLHSDDPA